MFQFLPCPAVNSCYLCHWRFCELSCSVQLFQTAVKFPLNTSASHPCWKRGGCRANIPVAGCAMQCCSACLLPCRHCPPDSDPGWGELRHGGGSQRLPALRHLRLTCSRCQMVSCWELGFWHVRQVPAGFPRFEKSAGYYFCGVKNRNVQWNCMSCKFSALKLAFKNSEELVYLKRVPGSPQYLFETNARLYINQNRVVTAKSCCSFISLMWATLHVWAHYWDGSAVTYRTHLPGHASMGLEITALSQQVTGAIK